MRDHMALITANNSRVRRRTKLSPQLFRSDVIIIKTANNNNAIKPINDRWLLLFSISAARKDIKVYYWKLFLLTCPIQIIRLLSAEFLGKISCTLKEVIFSMQFPGTILSMMIGYGSLLIFLGNFRQAPSQIALIISFGRRKTRALQPLENCMLENNKKQKQEIFRAGDWGIVLVYFLRDLSRGLDVGKSGHWHGVGDFLRR